MKKVKLPLNKAEKKSKRAKKENHLGRIAEVHLRNAEYFLKGIGSLPLNMAV